LSEEETTRSVKLPDWPVAKSPTGSAKGSGIDLKGISLWLTSFVVNGVFNGSDVYASLLLSNTVFGVDERRTICPGDCALTAQSKSKNATQSSSFLLVWFFIWMEIDLDLQINS
jgi:hypothetical protein